MQIIVKFLTKIFGKFVGSDNLGNQYYTLSFSKKNLQKRRVIYHTQNITCEIPPQWYCWLHHIHNNLPNEDIYVSQNLNDYYHANNDTKHNKEINETNNKYINNQSKLAVGEYEAWKP